MIEKKVSQAKLAAWLGIRHQTTTNWKQGRSKTFLEPDNLAKIAELLETTTSALLYGDEPSGGQPAEDAAPEAAILAELKAVLEKHSEILEKHSEILEKHSEILENHSEKLL
jgi:transcriptional regulator with XRE-family HTH domain